MSHISHQPTKASLSYSVYDEGVLTIRGLTKSFPAGGRHDKSTTALSSVDLDVAEGQFVTVLGPSGCGKTTLLRMIAGFESPDSGQIAIGGRPVTGSGVRPVPAHARGVGIVPQDGALFPHLSVGQNVAFGLTDRRRSARRRRVAEVLELVGLDGLEERHPHELSGGQQQRVALARAIAPDPAMILLDEPFSALDAHLRETVREEVQQVLRSIQATTILVTHDQAEALTLADHLVVMRDGAVAQTGPPRETYLYPQDIRLARFLGDAVVLPGQVCDGVVSCALGRLRAHKTVLDDSADGSDPGGLDTAGPCPARARGECMVMIRPEHIQLAPSDDAGATRSGAVGRITHQSFFGHDELLNIEIPNVDQQVAVRVLGRHLYRAGDYVRLRVDDPVCAFPQ